MVYYLSWMVNFKLNEYYSIFESNDWSNIILIVIKKFKFNYVIIICWGKIYQVKKIV